MPTEQQYHDAMSLKYPEYKEQREIIKLQRELNIARNDSATLRTWNAALVEDKADLRSDGAKLVKSLRNKIINHETWKVLANKEHAALSKDVDKAAERASMFEAALRTEQKLVDRYVVLLNKSRDRSAQHESAFLLAVKQRGELLGKLQVVRLELEVMTKRKDEYKKAALARVWSFGFPVAMAPLPPIPPLPPKIPAKILYDPEVNILRQRICELNTEVNRLQVKLAGAASEIDNVRSQRHDARNFTGQVQQDLRTAKDRIDRQNKFIDKALILHKAAEEKIANQRETIAHLQSNPLMHISPDGKPVTIYHAYPAKCWFPCSHNSCKAQP